MTDNIETGGPAFPVPINPGEPYFGHSPCDGMTLRDYFAAKAMQGYLTANHFPVDSVARWSYEVADAMLRARGNV